MRWRRCDWRRGHRCWRCGMRERHAGLSGRCNLDRQSRACTFTYRCSCDKRYEREHRRGRAHRAAHACNCARACATSVSIGSGAPAKLAYAIRGKQASTQRGIVISSTWCEGCLTSFGPLCVFNKYMLLLASTSVGLRTILGQGGKRERLVPYRRRKLGSWRRNSPRVWRFLACRNPLQGATACCAKVKHCKRELGHKGTRDRQKHCTRRREPWRAVAGAQRNSPGCFRSACIKAVR